MRDSVKYLTGAAITYLLVAACSGVEASDRGSQASDASPGRGGSEAGQQGTGGSGQIGEEAGLLDRLVAAVDSAIGVGTDAASNPEQPAQAAPLDETVACDVSLQSSWVTASFPGKNIAELSKIRIVSDIPPIALPGSTGTFSNVATAGGYLRQGEVAGYCNPGATSLTFYLD